MTDETSNRLIGEDAAKKWEEGYAAGAEDERKRMAAELRETERLETAMERMLRIFDRHLPPGSIGRRVCDEAKAALKEAKDGQS